MRNFSKNTSFIYQSKKKDKRRKNYSPNTFFGLNKYPAKVKYFYSKGVRKFYKNLRSKFKIPVVRSNYFFNYRQTRTGYKRIIKRKGYGKNKINPIKYNYKKNTFIRTKAFYKVIKWCEELFKRYPQNNSSMYLLRKKINHYFASTFRNQIIE
jgi:hypothetical protein